MGQAERNTSVQERKRTQKRATHMDWRDKRESERESQLGPQKCLYTHTVRDKDATLSTRGYSACRVAVAAPALLWDLSLSLPLSRSIELYNALIRHKQLKSLDWKLQERCHGEREQERVQKNQLEQRD